MNRKKVFLLIAIIVRATVSVLFLLWTKMRPLPSLAQTETVYEVEVAFPNLSFNQPVGIYSAGDGANHLFVLEKTGIVQVFENREDVIAATCPLRASLCAQRE